LLPFKRSGSVNVFGSPERPSNIPSRIAPNSESIVMMEQVKMMDGCVRKERISVSSYKMHSDRDKDRASRGNERKRVEKKQDQL
jgi:hypothetical protein